ncbi:MAG: ArsI/CadI family heavy metal resistance metalloenzyme [Alphaproteobacteria bacterium]
MKRFHVHLTVSDLDRSIGFYAQLFGAQPTVVKPDYAKWMLEDPRVNFAISTRAKTPGLDHLGIQVESEDELGTISTRLSEAGRSILEQKQAMCCYARSDKAWVNDPEGIAWESFVTFGDATVYGEDRDVAAVLKDKAQAAACCAPRTP